MKQDIAPGTGTFQSSQARFQEPGPNRVVQERQHCPKPAQCTTNQCSRRFLPLFCGLRAEMFKVTNARLCAFAHAINIFVQTRCYRGQVLPPATGVGWHSGILGPS